MRRYSKFIPVIGIALSTLTFTSCFKDEPLNAECDIEQAFIATNGRWICLPSSTPTLFNGDFRRPAVVSLLRLHIAPVASDGMLTVSAIALSLRMRLRTRLTPG